MGQTGQNPTLTIDINPKIEYTHPQSAVSSALERIPVKRVLLLVLLAILAIFCSSAVVTAAPAPKRQAPTDLPKFKAADPLPPFFVPEATGGTFVFGNDYYGVLDGDWAPHASVLYVDSFSGSIEPVFTMEEESYALGSSSTGNYWVGTVTSPWGTEGFVANYGYRIILPPNHTPQAVNDNGIAAGVEGTGNTGRLFRYDFNTGSPEYSDRAVTLGAENAVAVLNNGTVIINSFEGTLVWEDGEEVRLFQSELLTQAVLPNGSAGVGMTTSGKAVLFLSGELHQLFTGELYDLNNRFIVGSKVVPINRRTFTNVAMIASARTRTTTFVPLANLVTNPERGWSYTAAVKTGDGFILANRFHPGNRRFAPSWDTQVLVPVRPN